MERPSQGWPVATLTARWRGKPGLFGAGRADEQVEAGTGDDALDEGGLGRRRGFKSFPGGIDA